MLGNSLDDSQTLIQGGFAYTMLPNPKNERIECVTGTGDGKEEREEEERREGVQ